MRSCKYVTKIILTKCEHDRRKQRKTTICMLKVVLSESLLWSWLFYTIRCNLITDIKHVIWNTCQVHSHDLGFLCCLKVRTVIKVKNNSSRLHYLIIIYRRMEVTCVLICIMLHCGPLRARWYLLGCGGRGCNWRNDVAPLDNIPKLLLLKYIILIVHRVSPCTTFFSFPCFYIY